MISYLSLGMLIHDFNDTTILSISSKKASNE